MANDKVRLITHPMRAQIITAVTGRPLTIAQIGAVLPEIPLPSLYRHVRQLVDGGILVAVDEVRVSGALTRVYGVQENKTTITPEDTEHTPIGDHVTYFTSFTEMLNASFRNYINQEGADPRKDLVSALMTILYIAPEEYGEFERDLAEIVQKWEQRPRPENGQRMIVAHIAFPDKSDPHLT